MKLFDELAKKEIAMHSFHFNALLKVCAKIGDDEGAVVLLFTHSIYIYIYISYLYIYIYIYIWGGTRVDETLNQYFLEVALYYSSRTDVRNSDDVILH